MNDLAPEHPDASTGTPRISIVHIMLWTAISAIYVSLLRWIYAQQEWPEDIIAMQRASGIVNAIIVGAAITGTIVLIQARVIWRRTQLLSHPGHWLLVIQSFFAMLSLGVYSLFTLLLKQITSSPYQNLFVMMYGLSFLAMTVAYLLAAWRTQASRWKAVFLGICLVGALQSVTYLVWIPLSSHFVTYLRWAGFIRLAVVVWMVAIAIWEITQSQRRDWLHWLGVVTYLASVFVTFLQSLWQMLFR